MNILVSIQILPGNILSIYFISSSQLKNFELLLVKRLISKLLEDSL